MRGATSIAMLLLLGACKSGPAPSSSATSSSTVPAARPFDGLYDVERITRNTAGCDAEGKVAEENVKCFYLRRTLVFGKAAILGGGQEALGDCERLAKGESIQIYDPVVLDSALDSAEPHGDLGASSMPEHGTCHAEPETARVRWIAADRIRVEVRRTNVEFPCKEIGTTRQSVDAAVGKPCSRLTVIEARYHGTLPEVSAPGGQ